MDIELEVTHALDQIYPGSTIKLEPTESGKIGGYVISDAFAGMTHLDRQDALWGALAQRLPPETLRRIISILTMTPDEVFDEDEAGTEAPRRDR